MKKFYILVTIVLFSSYLMAQTSHKPEIKSALKTNSSINLQSTKLPVDAKLNLKKSTATLKSSKGKESKWFSYAGTWQDSLFKDASSANLWSDVLYTDETAFIGSGDYHFNPSWTGMAVVLDPGAPIFKKQLIDRTTAYKIDSIALYAQYERHYKDANVTDTLIVEVVTNYFPLFDGFSGSKTLYPPFKYDTIYYGMVWHDSKMNYDKTSTDYVINNTYKLPYKTKVQTYKIKLTKETLKDTIPNSGGIIKISFPTPNTGTDSLLSIATFRFKPGYATKEKDTILKNGNLFQFLSYQERGADTYQNYNPNDFNVSYTLPFASLTAGTDWEFDYMPSYFLSILFDSPTTLQNHLVEFKLSYTYCPCNIAFDAGINTTLKCGDKSELKTSVDVCNTSIKYKWSPTAGLSSSTISNPLASPTSTTTYTVTITSGTCKAKNSIKLTVTPLTANAGLSQTITCGENAPLEVTSNQSGGTLTYKWSPTTGLSSNTINNPIASPITTTTYKVTVSSGTGCNATSSVLVTVNPLFTADAGINKTISCGDSTQLNVAVTPLTDNLIYSWAPSTGLSETGIANPKAFPTTTTKYIVTVSDPQGGNCKPAIDSLTVIVGKSDFNVNFSANNTNPNSDPPYVIEFTNQTPKLAKYKYSWDFGDGTSIVNSNNLKVSHTYQKNGSYTVKLNAKINGSVCNGDSLVQENYIVCTSSTSVPVGNIVIQPDTIKVGKGFSKSFTVQILPTNATNKTVTWKIDDSKIAFIDNTGQVTGLQYGYTDVTARTTDGGFTSKAVVKVYNAQGISEYENNITKVSCSPNPFDTRTIISYTLTDNAFTTIKIYDIIGNEIKTLLNENTIKGEHSVLFDGEGLESGLYYYKIKTNNNYITGKMTLVK